MGNEQMDGSSAVHRLQARQQGHRLSPAVAIAHQHERRFETLNRRSLMLWVVAQLVPEPVVQAGAMHVLRSPLTVSANFGEDPSALNCWATWST